MLVFFVFGLFISFFLIRASVRSNEQIDLLKQINEKQSAQIDLLISIAHPPEK
ncbi:YebO family protein [Dickeya oryzae]|nr:YebO family protein [Dickeya oryzae]